MSELTKQSVSPSRVAMMTLHVLEELDRATEQTLLAPSRVRILLYLYAHGEIQQKNLENVAGVEKSATSTALIALGAGKKDVRGLGLVVQERDFADGRHIVVRLTARGKAVMEGAMARVAASLSSPSPS